MLSKDKLIEKLDFFNQQYSRNYDKTLLGIIMGLCIALEWPFRLNKETKSIEITPNF